MADHKRYKTEKPEARDPLKLIAQGAPYVPKGQRWGIVAFCKDQEGKSAMSFIGVSKTLKGADKIIEENRKRGFTYPDIYKVKLGPHVTNPPPKHLTDIVYHQKELQKLMASHLAAGTKAAEELERRLDQERDAEEVHKTLREKIEAKSKGAATITTLKPPPGVIVTKPVKLFCRPQEDGKDQRKGAISKKDSS